MAEQPPDEYWKELNLTKIKKDTGQMIRNMESINDFHVSHKDETNKDSGVRETLETAGITGGLKTLKQELDQFLEPQIRPNKGRNAIRDSNAESGYDSRVYSLSDLRQAVENDETESSDNKK